MSEIPRHRVAALVVRQWLQEWDLVRFSDEELRRQPEPRFYMFTLPAQQLRRLSKIYRRKAKGPRALDTFIQRAHDPRRSAEIRRFVEGGFPWSDLSERRRESAEYRDLRMPGWLPTAIIANILPPDAQRGGRRIHEDDVIQIEPLDDTRAYLTLPERVNDPNWDPEVPPIEIIDGQHRLWAFEGRDKLAGAYNLPVVAFHNLDVTWQAYLFYTINIKPKRINASLAFDLYPILRVQDWLEKSPFGPAIYRETRAQELTEVLWSHPQSPWHNRINMLGERGEGPVTQAAFIRSLMASYVKRSTGRGVTIGGLFGGELHAGAQDVLQWNRPQQAAFLILVWLCASNAVAQCNEAWAESLRQIPVQRELMLDIEEKPILDPAFASEYSLLSTDQGVRGILYVTNDMCYVAADSLELTKWQWDEEIEEDVISPESVSEALQQLQHQPVREYLEVITTQLSQFDWRISSTPGLTESERQSQMVFRGSGGYKELRRQLLHLLMSARNDQVGSVAEEVIERLGYE
jgi:hypothetical protein